MDYFGINSADELPKITEVLMEELVQATVMNSGSEQDDENSSTNHEEIAATENISPEIITPDLTESNNEEEKEQ